MVAADAIELAAALIGVVEVNAAVLLDELCFGEPSVSFYGLFLLRVVVELAPGTDKGVGRCRKKLPVGRK